MTLQEIIGWVALVFAGICFLLFLADAVRRLKDSKPSQTITGLAAKVGSTNEGVAIAGFNDSINALAKLTDALTKAGPGLVALVGSILFLVVAAIAAGVLQDPPASDKGKAKSTAERAGSLVIAEASLPYARATS